MAAKTEINWTDATWNPVTGCTKVSPACDHCYAERMANRRVCEWASRKFSEVHLHPNRLEIPLHWRKPRRIFLCSMGDLFHADVPFWFIASVWDTMLEASRHTFMVLTKRPERMLELSQWMNDNEGRRIDYHNIWLGVTAENQEQADKRIPLLLQCPAAHRFVSVEPMLGEVRLDNIAWISGGGQTIINALTGRMPNAIIAGKPAWPHLDLVIVGGETGPGARPMHPDWARSLRDQCDAAGVCFHFKQWGDWIPMSQQTRSEEYPNIVAYGANGMPPNGYSLNRCYNWPDQSQSYHCGKRNAGRLLDGRTHDHIRDATKKVKP